MYFLPLPKICWNIRETWSDTLYIMMTLSNNMFWWIRHVGMSVCTWFILINLVCLCLPEVLLSARASPSPNKVQGCNDCMLSCKHLFMERVCAVCDHVTDKISTLTPADRLCKKGRTLPPQAFVLFYLFFSFIFVLHFFFFTNNAVQMNALYSHSITRRCNTLWGTNKTLKKK